MSNVDVAWLRMDEPTNLMMINGVLAFDQPLDPDQVRGVLERRMLAIPRFRQRVVVPDRGKPHWELDPDFALERHFEVLELPGAGGEAELAETLSVMVSRPPDYDRPLWSFHLLQNYQGGSALFGRLHHCIGDGIALMLVLMSLTDVEAELFTEELGNPLCELFRPGATDLEAVRLHTERLLPDAMKLMLHPVEALRSTHRWLVRTAATGAFGKLVVRKNDPRTLFKGRLGVDKRVAWSEPVPMDDVRAIKQTMGGTVNDVLMTAMTGGLRRYVDGRGELPAGRLDFRAAVPVNLRPLENMTQLGNEFGLVFLSLPLGISDPQKRLDELRRRMAILKRSAESVMVLSALKLLGMAPAVVQRLVVRVLAEKATAVMTNVPGPRETVFFAGRPIRDIFFWVPQTGRLGIGISILSYAGRARLGVVTDSGLVPDPERIIDGFHRELEDMLRLAGRGAERPSGEPVAAAGEAG